MNKNDLSPDQREAYSGILTWLDRGTETQQTLTFAGYAGTGKTTVVGVLAHELPQPLAFCAYTGKASSVLARKLKEQGIETTARTETQDEFGLPVNEARPYCGTIHGLVYRPCEVCRPKETRYSHELTGNCRTIKDDKCSEHDAPRGRCPDCERCLACEPPPPPPRRSGPCHRCGNFGFLRRDSLDRDYKLIVCDEASMVSDEMLDAMLQYDVPILAVGDHGQLKPVRGAGSLMQRPDIRLEKIHRQAENNLIIALSKFVRETGTVDPRFCDGAHVWMDSDRRLPDFVAKSFKPGRDDLLSMVILSWTNRSRVWINRTVRRVIYGDENKPPQRGDVVISLKNKPPIYNGMRGIITTDPFLEDEEEEKRPKWVAKVDFPEDATMDEATMSGLQLYAEKTIDYDRAYELGVAPVASLGDLYDYGYALTCHKMQGSQAEKVAVVLDGVHRMGVEERTRWIYTAVTRSSDKLVVFR